MRSCRSIFCPNAVYSPLACIQLTLRTARATGLPIDRLIFEFTENEAMGSPDHVASIIDTYKQIGFSVAIDDFGAGHSGLDMFARFVPDEMKAGHGAGPRHRPRPASSCDREGGRSDVP